MSEKARKVEIYKGRRNQPFYNIFVGNERIAEYVSWQWATAIVDKYNAKTENKSMKALLKDLAGSACDNCGEKDCADCWCMDYLNFNSKPG